MSHNLEFIQELLDEGLLSTDIGLKSYHFNDSLIGDANLRLYGELPHYRCSVNQSRLAGWSWLIGSNGGALKPLMCVARRRDRCTSEYLHHRLNHRGNEIWIALTCVLVLLNLVSMAVWFRCKMPSSSSGKREASIQLLLLRVFSALVLVSSLSNGGWSWWKTDATTRVFSVFHAIVLSQVFSTVILLLFLSHVLSVVLAFLTSIYLVEHSHIAQPVLVFGSLRRVQIVLCVAMVICAIFCSPNFIRFGYIYCSTNSTTYLLHSPYIRVSRKLSSHLVNALNIFELTGGALAIIMVIVYALKRCCTCHRCTPPVTHGSGTVTYTRQLDEADGGDGEAGQQVVIVDVRAPVPQHSSEDELRRLIFWHQVAFYAMAVVFETIFHILYYVFLPRLMKSGSFQNGLNLMRLATTLMIIRFILRSLRLTVLSMALSPTYRTCLMTLLVELKNSVAAVARG